MKQKGEGRNDNLRIKMRIREDEGKNEQRNERDEGGEDGDGGEG